MRLPKITDVHGSLVRVSKRRTLNPTPAQWILLTFGTLALVGAVGGTAYAMRKRRSSSKTPGIDLPDVGPGEPTCDPAPYEIDPDALRILVQSKVDAGLHDKARIARDVAITLFGAHPSGSVVDFPPSGDPLEGVGCVWDWTIWTVDDVFRESGLTDEPTLPSGPSGSLQWVSRTANDPGYPWEEPVLHVHNWPTPGMFLDIGNAEGSWDPANGYDSMVIAALGSALAMAGLDPSIAEGPEGQELRKQLRQAIMAVGGFNDLNYGQTNLNYAGGNDPSKPGGNKNKGIVSAHVLNEQGRGLNWLPHHKDNKKRIAEELPSKRGSGIKGNRLTGAQAGYRHMLVWIPAVSLDALREVKPRIAFGTWSDGSSTADPPPQIRALGYDLSGVDLPGVTDEAPDLQIPFTPV